MIEPLRRTAEKPGGGPVDRRLAQRHGQSIVQEMKDDSRQDAAAADGDQSQDEAQQRRVEQLLVEAEQDVEEPEQERREHDRGAGLMPALEPREDEAAEGELLADGGDQGQQHEPDPE